MKYLCSLLLITLVLPLQVVAKDNRLDPELLQCLGGIKYHELKWAHLGRSFHIFVDLPEGYRDTELNYPTIYLLYIHATVPRQLYFIRLFRSTGLSFRLNWPAMADTYRPMLQKNLISN